MSTASALARRVFVGSIIDPDAAPEPPPSSYKDILQQNEHLRNLVNALLKERTGQHLNRDEQRLIDQHIAARRWQLEHEKKD